ncbi:MAG: ABC-three component system protein [bacterium]
MDLLTKAYYDVKFENAFLKAKGNAFQGFFNELMDRAFKGDFMPCRPWGKQGDQKNDGFLKSERRLFQVYAPNEMKATEANKKIDDDFNGALKYWNKYFDKWAFVHNASEGIPAHIQKKILELEKLNQGIKLDIWGLEKLREIFHHLEKDDLESWFGNAPDNNSKLSLGFEEIKVLLETIRLKRPDFNSPVKQVPPNKIEANQLSESISILIKEGMTKASLVEEFFNKWYDPTFGENIAVTFREKYEILRNSFLPNEIFHELQTWIGGSLRGTAEHEMAVLAIISYFFERCDIFEEPKN